MNIVLDTNSLIMSISPRSPYRSVWQSFLCGDYTLCISNEIIEEYAEVMARNISPRVSEAIVYAILTRPNVLRVDPHYSFGLITADTNSKPKFVEVVIGDNEANEMREPANVRNHRNPYLKLSYPNGVTLILPADISFYWYTIG